MDDVPQQKNGTLKEIITFSIIALIIVVPIRLYVAQPFLVQGASMQPSFENGDYLIVFELGYRFVDPSRGEVVIFRSPEDPSKFFIKRIIGLPNETVSIDGTDITIKNEEFPEGFTIDESYLNGTSKEDLLSLSLNDDEYFVLGDNRNNSSDSRRWGALERNEIIGRALIRLLPLNKVGVFPGDFSNELDVPLVTLPL